MGDCITTIHTQVEIQENGIIRLEDGRLIGRLVDSFDFSILEVSASKPELENARLKAQIEKVLEALGVEDVDVPCPSNVGLNDSFECGLSIECPQCWRDALEAVGESEVSQA